MKCPKCGYVSFDHNENCPKCKKDVSSERDRMNLPAHKVDPPFLLGTLIGEFEGSSAEPGIGPGGEVGVSSEFAPEGEILSPQASDREVLEEGQSTDFPLEESSEEFTIELGDFEFEEQEADEEVSEPSEMDFIHLDDLIKGEPESSFDEVPIGEEEPSIEPEPLDLTFDEGIDNLDFSSTDDQEVLETPAKEDDILVEVEPLDSILQEEGDALDLPSTGDREVLKILEKEDDILLEVEPLDSALQEGTDGLDLPPTGDQEVLETLELDLELEEPEEKSS